MRKTLINDQGYILIYKPKHPFANNIGYVREHKLVMEKNIGRYIDSSKEDIHHINEIVSDNRLENLILLTKSEHRRTHAGWKMINKEWYKPCSDCKELLPLDRFYKRNNGKTLYICAECSCKRSKIKSFFARLKCVLCGKIRSAQVLHYKNPPKHCRSCSALLDWKRRKK